MNHQREIVGAGVQAQIAGLGPPGLDPMPSPLRDPQPMLERTLAEWGGHDDLWLFGYGSLIWRPDFEFAERRPARIHGWHRALKMWSRVNRGTPHNPGLVFGLLSGGSCQGMAFRIPAAEGAATLARLWLREMPTGVYDPRWLDCVTPGDRVRALAFTLSRRSPNFTGELSEARYREIFASASGRYGSSIDYARLTLLELRRHAIHDRRLARLVALADAAVEAEVQCEVQAGMQTEAQATAQDGPRPEAGPASAPRPSKPST